MIAKAATMEDNEERDALIRLIANHMKKLMLAVNPDGVDDAKDIQGSGHVQPRSHTP